MRNLSSIIQQILPASAFIDTCSKLYRDILPKFWHSVAPTRKENLQNFVHFCSIITLEMFRSYLIVWSAQYRTGLDVALFRNFPALSEAITYFVGVKIIEELTSYIQLSSMNYIVGENKVRAQEALEAISHNHYTGRTPTEIAKIFSEKVPAVEFQTVELSYKFITTSIRFMLAMYHLATIRPISNQPYENDISKIYQIYGFGLIICFGFTLIASAIPRYLAGKLSDLHDKKHGEAAKTESMINFNALNQRDITQNDQQKTKSEELRKQFRKAQAAEVKYHNYTLAQNMLDVCFDVAAHVLSLVIVVPYFERNLHVKDLTWPREISVYFKNIVNGFQFYTGKELKSFGVLQNAKNAVDGFVKINESLNEQFNSCVANRTFSKTENHHMISDLEITTPNFKLKLIKPIIIRKGEIVRFIEESGYGKSCVLQAITGRRLIVCNSNINFALNKESEIYYISQKPLINFNEGNLTIGNLIFPLTKDQEEQANHRRTALELLDLFQFSKKRVSCESDFDETGIDSQTLSGGEIQKLMIVKALLTKPKLLMIDETFSQIDPDGKEKICQKLKELARNENLTIIYTDHKENAAFADQEIILSDYFETKQTKTSQLESEQQQTGESKKSR